MNKYISIILITILIITSLGIIPTYAASPTVTVHGQQIYVDGVVVSGSSDPNVCNIDPNGNAKFKTILQGGNTVVDSSTVVPCSHISDSPVSKVLKAISATDPNSTGLTYYIEADPNAYNNYTSAQKGDSFAINFPTQSKGDVTIILTSQGVTKATGHVKYRGNVLPYGALAVGSWYIFEWETSDSTFRMMSDYGTISITDATGNSSYTIGKLTSAVIQFFCGSYQALCTTDPNGIISLNNYSATGIATGSSFVQGSLVIGNDPNNYIIIIDPNTGTNCVTKCRILEW